MTVNSASSDVRRLLPPPPLFLLQPVLRRIVHRIADECPTLFARLGPHRSTRFLIDAKGLPFLLLLRPDPDDLELRACARNFEPHCDARIGGGFLDLLRLVDGREDGDALFFSRDLEITGNIEAVVSLRNALDDVDGSIAGRVADMFGPAGRLALAITRRVDDQTSPRREMTQ